MFETIYGDDNDFGKALDNYGLYKQPDRNDLLNSNEGTIFTCQSFIANKVAGTCHKLYHKNKKVVKSKTQNNLKQVTSGDIVELIENPNKDMSFGQILQIVSAHLDLVGECFLLKRRFKSNTNKDK